MRLLSFSVTATMFAALAALAPAQIVLPDSEPAALLSQTAPAPPNPPAPPAPQPPMGEIVRLMSSNGSYLGVGVRDVDSDRKQALNLKEERGAEITSVEENSPAAKAGLKTGDVVLEFAGNRVESMEQFIRLVRETPAGREVKMAVSRAGSLTTISARPESARSRLERSIQVRIPSSGEIRAMVHGFDSPRAAMYWKSSQLGVEAESVDSQLAEFFGIKQGVLVRSVSRETPAEKAGVRAGDVIVRVEETRVSSPREVTTAVREARASARTVNLTVVREKKELALKVTFEDQPPPRAPRARTIQNKFQ
ncbi:MAG: PDZ domain-containing protein [Bryobacter sp.]|nr:PDZ domain-containing protein [Bryobacter sp. CoA8 C33]